jgi:hypothetical protein
MNGIRKRALRDMACMALSGTCETTDAGVVLGISLQQLRLTVAALNTSIEACDLDRNDLQSHLIGIRHRLEALENFADECLAVSFLPLGEEDEGALEQGLAP